MNKQYSASEIAEATRVYLEASNNFFNANGKSDLINMAEANVRYFEDNVMSLYNDNKLKPHFTDAIRTGEMMYETEHPHQTKEEFTQNLDRTAEIQVRALVKKEKAEDYSYTKGGYINVAILLYGILNIGIIVAIAFMK